MILAALKKEQQLRTRNPSLSESFDIDLWSFLHEEITLNWTDNSLPVRQLELPVVEASLPMKEANTRLH